MGKPVQHLTLAGERQLSGQAVFRGPACKDTPTDQVCLGLHIKGMLTLRLPSHDLQGRGSMKHPATIVKDLPAGGMILAMPAAAPVALMRLM